MKKTNIVEFWESSEKVQNDVEKARERFEEKSYYHEWKGIKTMAQTFAAIMPTVSLITGILYVADLLGMLVPYSIALVLGFVLISGWEIGKSKLLSLCFTLVYKRSKAFLGLSLVCILFSIVSAYTSIEGANTAFSKVNNEVQMIEYDQAKQTAALSANYDSLIAIEDSSKRAYVLSVSWKGKININNKTTKGVIASHTEEIKRLREEKNDKLSKQETMFDKLKGDAKDSSGYKLAYVLVFVAIIELLIIACNWFPVYFEYRVNSQRETIEDNLNGQQITITPDKLATFVSSHLMPQYAMFANSSASSNLGSNQGSSGSNRPSIGFPSSSPNGSSNLGSNPSNSSYDAIMTNISSNPSANVSELKAYLYKHRDTVDAICANMSEREALEYANVGRTTYYNVKRCINNLNSGVIDTKHNC